MHSCPPRALRFLCTRSGRAGSVRAEAPALRKQVDDGGQHGGQGTITAEKMRRLDRADGPGGQRLFLQSMIRHHQGAVAMAETEIAEGKHPAAIQLAGTIAKRLEQEIETMQELLTNL